MKELITGHVPYDGDSHTTTSVIPAYIRDAKLRVTISKGTLPDDPGNLNGAKKWLWDEICILCWKKDPGERMTVGEVVSKLKFVVT